MDRRNGNWCHWVSKRIIAFEICITISPSPFSFPPNSPPDYDESAGGPKSSSKTPTPNSTPTSASGMASGKPTPDGSASNTPSSQSASASAAATTHQQKRRGAADAAAAAKLDEQQRKHDEARTQEEKRKQIKNIIDRIPVAKGDLFNFQLDWAEIDNVLMEKKIRPWIHKKIVEYIGEPEPTLVDFICSKVMAGSTPQTILDDVQMVRFPPPIDDDASGSIRCSF